MKKTGIIPEKSKERHLGNPNSEYVQFVQRYMPEVWAKAIAQAH